MVVQEILTLAKAKSPLGRRYSHEWLLTSILLHIKSPALYFKLLKDSIFPLPSKVIIRRYLKDSNVGVGFDESFFNLFAKKMKILEETNPVSLHGMILYDEVMVRKALGVNVQTCSFVGLMDFGNEKIMHDDPKLKKTKKKNNAPGEITAEKKVKDLRDMQADHALVFMFSSLKGNFSQPVGVIASQGTTPALQLAKSYGNGL